MNAPTPAPGYDSATLMEMYPDGRTFYDETDDQKAFVRTCHGHGLTVSIHHPPEQGRETWATVYIPAHKLEWFYALNLRVGT